MVPHQHIPPRTSEAHRITITAGLLLDATAAACRGADAGSHLSADGRPGGARFAAVRGECCALSRTCSSVSHRIASNSPWL